MSIQDIILFTICVLAGFAVGYSINQDKATYATNLAKFEIMYEKCMEHKNATVSECQKIAEVKSKTCVEGCE